MSVCNGTACSPVELDCKVPQAVVLLSSVRVVVCMLLGSAAEWYAYIYECQKYHTKDILHHLLESKDKFYITENLNNIFSHEKVQYRINKNSLKSW